MSYTERLKKHRKERNLKWPGGRYTCVLKDYFSERSKTGPAYNPKAVMELRVIKGPEGKEEEVNLLIGKNRQIKNHQVFSAKGWGFDQFLDTLDQLGADLSKCRPADQDPEYSDLFAIARTAVNNFSPKVELDLSWKEENSQFPDIKIISVEKVFSPETASISPPPPQTNHPAPPPVQETDQYFGANSDNTTVGPYIFKEMQALILLGKVVQVSKNGEGWCVPELLGFTLPASQVPPVADVHVPPTVDVVAPPIEKAPETPPPVEAPPLAMEPPPAEKVTGTAPGAPIDPFA